LIFREVEDRDLVIKARRGNVESYNLLVSRWERRIFNYLLRLVKNREDAFDLSQDVFLKAYQNLSKLEDVSRFSPWLYRIAHNEAYSLLRKHRPETDSDSTGDDLSFGWPANSRRLMPLEAGLAVESAMARLSAEQREAVVLKIYQGFKFEEMAEILSCPVSTIKSRLYTALDLLKDMLTTKGVTER